MDKSLRDIPFLLVYPAPVIDQLAFRFSFQCRIWSINLLSVLLAPTELNPLVNPSCMPAFTAQVHDQTSTLLTAQLLFLEAEDSKRPIKLYINSPGGSVSAGLAIYDTMQYITPPVHTFCMGIAASMGSLLLAGGEKGNRFALKNSTVMIHRESERVWFETGVEHKADMPSRAEWRGLRSSDGYRPSRQGDPTYPSSAHRYLCLPLQDPGGGCGEGKGEV